MSDKVALVTGASRGIGRAIAAALGKQGFTVVGTATTDSGAANISAFFVEAGIKGVGLALNVTDAAADHGTIRYTDHSCEQRRHYSRQSFDAHGR